MGKRIDRRLNAKSLVCGILVAVGLYILYFAGLGSYPLTDPDEAVYGQVAKEMAAGAGWLTPHYNGGMWFDKPPLFYWLSGVSAKLLEPTEAASRLPSAILAVALVLLVYKLISHDFGKRAGIFGAVAMATCFQQIVLARASVTDMTFVLCLTSALYAYRRWLDACGKSRLAWMTLCGAMTGLAMLAKGPVAPALLFATFFIHLLWTRRLRNLLSLDAALGIVAALIVGLPWFAAMYVLHRDAFVQGFLVANNVVRFLKPEHPEQTGKWYFFLLNIPTLLVFFFPWSAFLPQGIARTWRANDGARLASVWFAVVFVFFSISKTQLVTYIFPLYPAAALFVGSLWNSDEPGAKRSVRRGLWTALVFSLLVAAGLVMSAHRKYPEAEQPALVMGTILVVALVAGLIFARRENRSPAVWAIGGGMTLFALWLITGVIPHAGSRISTRDLVTKMPRIPGAQVYELNAKRPSMLFYSDRLPVHMEDAAAAREALARKTPVILICRESKADQVAVKGSVQCAESGDLTAIMNAAAASLKGSQTR